MTAMNKKIYKHPKLRVVELNPTEIMNTSTDFRQLKRGYLNDADAPSSNFDDNEEWVIWGE